MVSPNNWEAVVVEQREKVQIFQLEGDLRRENRKENWIVYFKSVRVHFVYGSDGRSFFR